MPLKAGLRIIGASFPKNLALDEHVVPKSILGPRRNLRRPRFRSRWTFRVDGARVQRLTVPSVATGPNVSQSFYMRDVMQISVAGPYDVTGVGDTASRRKIFLCHPGKGIGEEACARKIVTVLARHAYRRPVTAVDVTPLMKMYAQGRKGADFEHGIEAAVEAVLVSPDFLFMRESDPAKSAAGDVHKISDVELATRLSFFLWSSIPDDELLSLAEKKQLSKPDVLKAQVARMLADPKSRRSPTTSPASGCICGVWSTKSPIAGPIPDFDVRLRDGDADRDPDVL